MHSHPASRGVALLLVLAAAAPVACGSSEVEEPPAPSAPSAASAANPVEPARDAGSDAEKPSTCAASRSSCGGACVDTQSDRSHCGGCTTVCAADKTCTKGACVAIGTGWVNSWPNAALNAPILASATDAAGNIYVAGHFVGTINLGGGPLTSAGNDDILVASFSPTGGHRWSKRFGGVGFDVGEALTVDNKGNVYVSGVFEGSVDLGGGAVASAGKLDGFILRLTSADGSFGARWVFGGNGNDRVSGIAVDGSGNMTAVGTFSSETLSFGGGASLSGTFNGSAFVVGLDAAGGHRWSRAPQGSSSSTSVAVDGAGNVVMSGGFGGTADFGFGPVTSNLSYDMFVAGYSSTGVPRFARPIGGSGFDFASSVATDASGNVFAIGDFAGTVDFGTGPIAGISNNGFLLALDENGATKFVRTLSTPNSKVTALATDGTSAIVAGYVTGPIDLGTGPLAPVGTTDMFVARYRADGVTQVARRFGGSGYALPQTVASDAPHGIVIGGRFKGTVDLGNGPVTGATDTDFVMMLAP